jgi:hypothetical protein
VGVLQLSQQWLSSLGIPSAGALLAATAIAGGSGFAPDGGQWTPLSGVAWLIPSDGGWISPPMQSMNVAGPTSPAAASMTMGPWQVPDAGLLEVALTTVGTNGPTLSTLQGAFLGISDLSVSIQYRLDGGP